MNRIFVLSCLIVAIGTYAQPHYNFSKLKREKTDRGVVAVRQDADTVCVSWRYLSSDSKKSAFNLYRNGTLLNSAPLKESTFFKDAVASTQSLTYTVTPVMNGVEVTDESSQWTLPALAPSGYLSIPLDIPEGGTTLRGEPYSYSANDASMGDVDGDGRYEIILKWEPTNARDNSHNGYTGATLYDCYRLTGEKLWRINIGHNIRAGAHYEQFVVFDLDGDNRAEVVMRTADGTIDGKGNVIGDATVDNREETGRILTGKEYLTVFNGLTGEAMQSTDYIPHRGEVESWGDPVANRSDRFLSCVAYLDGKQPSVVMCRGYYTRSVLAAWDWRDGKLSPRWVFDSNKEGNEKYAGQGNHNLSVGDVDGDGCDEIIYGSCAIDNTGKGLYTTGMGHGDAMHLTAFVPGKKLQLWKSYEDSGDGSALTDAKTGKVLFQIKSPIDVGRAMAADIDPTNKGLEMWSSASGGIRTYKGEVLNARPNRLPTNMAVWWDGDLLREMLDQTTISKYDWTTGTCLPVLKAEECSSNNGSKSNPCLACDIIGDWREEVIWRTRDNSELRVYVTTIATPYRFHTFLEDPVYRISIANQNVAYNQPTQVGFYFGADLKGSFRGTKIKNK
ncbi:MAG: rhamnogalacturonan lyase [Bacteroidales bacterium]|nr:rhamnogalacturonan lyase [Bacteroidales bacterium]